MKQKIHIGDLVALPGVVYDFQKITGNLDCAKADEKTQFPALTTIGGSAYFRGWTGSAPDMKTNGWRRVSVTPREPGQKTFTATFRRVK